MADIHVQIKNLDQIKAAFKSAPDKMAKELNIAIQKVLLSIQAETLLNVGGQRGIRVITHGLASAAERPPVFTHLKGVYDIDIKYAPFVHDGTRFMKARPFLQRAVDTKKDLTDKFFTEAVDKVLSDIGKAT